MRVAHKINLGFGLALLAVLAIGAVALRQTQALVEDNRWVAHAQEVLGSLDHLMYLIASTESAHRGFLNTGDRELLERHAQLDYGVPRELEHLRSLLAEEPAQQQRLAQLVPLVTHKLEIMRQGNSLKQAQREEEARNLLRQEGVPAMKALQLHVAEMRQQEELLLAQRTAEVARGSRLTLALLALGTLWALALGLYSRLLVFRDADQRTRIERELAEANERLSAGLRELNERTAEMALLHEVTDLLQSCRDLKEAAGVVRDFAPRLFPEARNGVLYLLRDSLEPSATWGEKPQFTPFAPEDCWGLRRGRPYASPADGTQPRCGHLSGSQGHAMCLPLLAHNETVGSLVMECRSAASPSEACARLATTAAESIALALANLRLRESLHAQSIRDPLTGLFNRRYLEETLHRELRRTQRTGRPLALAIFDLDHFKHFNDSYGHPAGDLLLTEFAALLRRGSRSSDVAARLGGEEFVLLLLDATLEQARTRVQNLCDELRRARFQYQGQALGTVTASAGLAASLPEQSAEDLIRVADSALYRAKTEGRDRIVVAEADVPHPLRVQ